MLVGYMRVSKADGSQTTDPQRDALVEAGVDDERLYEDRASGRRDDRPGLAECLKSLRAGDTLVIWKLDRFGRDLHHLVNTVHDLTARRIGLKVLTRQGAAIDTTTAAGKLVFGIFAALAEFSARPDVRTHDGRPGRCPRPGAHRRAETQARASAGETRPGDVRGDRPGRVPVVHRRADCGGVRCQPAHDLPSPRPEPCFGLLSRADVFAERRCDLVFAVGPDAGVGCHGGVKVPGWGARPRRDRGCRSTRSQRRRRVAPEAAV